MNIFYLDTDYQKAATAHCDKHVNKMIIEHLQMMSVVAHEYGVQPARRKNGELYKVRGFKNHPCTRWVAASQDNFIWTWNLTWSLCEEFLTRYNKHHSGFNSLKSIDLAEIMINMPKRGITPPAQAMPDCCKVEGDAVAAYRNYYNWFKWRFASWKNQEPEWWAPGCEVGSKNEYD